MFRDAVWLLTGVFAKLTPFPIQGWRWLLIGLIFGLLYLALANPSERGQKHSLRRLVFALLGAWVCFNLTASWTQAGGGEQPTDSGRGFQAYSNGTLSYRLSFAAIPTSSLGMGNKELRTKAIGELREAVKSVPENVAFRRYLGIALAEQGQYPEALTQLEQASKLLEQRAPERAARERALWRLLYGTDPPTQSQIRQAGQEIETLQLGWIGRVALQAAYERFDPSAVPTELTQRIQREATDYFRNLAMTVLGLIILLPQLTLIVLVVGLIWVCCGVIPRVPRRQHPVCPILWESFILMMAISLLPVTVLLGGKRPSPEAHPGQIAMLLMSQDILQLGAVAYLVWQLSIRRLTPAEIGLTTRHFWSNVGIGIAAALVLIPLTVLVAIASEKLGRLFFPNIAPPYHPLQGMTAVLVNPLIRWALFLTAAVGAPLLEETFFRGVLYGALRRKWGIGFALLLSSAFFSLLHPQLPLGFVPIAFLGASFCLLYEWRQSLIPGMVAHALNNGLIFFILTVFFPPNG